MHDDQLAHAVPLELRIPGKGWVCEVFESPYPDWCSPENIARVGVISSTTIYADDMVIYAVLHNEQLVRATFQKVMYLASRWRLRVNREENQNSPHL